MPRAKEYQGTVSPAEIRMTHAQAEQEFDQVAMADAPGSWYAAQEAVRHQMAWLEYVPEDDLPEGERQRIVLACRRLYATLRPLTAKYID